MTYEKDMRADFLLDAIRIGIEGKFGSLNYFCEAVPDFDVSDLSRFLAGKKNWNYQKFLWLLMCVDTEIIFHWYRLGTKTDTGMLSVKYDPHKRNNHKFVQY